MSLYTSRSEFDLEKRVRFTNEIPPYDMFDGLNSVLQNTLWQWVLGYTKVSFDLPYAVNTIKEDYNGNEYITKDRQAGIDAGEVYYKMVNGKVVEDVQYGPAENANENYHKLEEYGVLIPEFDYLLHEVYRYLGAMYPDHPDYTELLTANEFDDMIASAGAVIDYEPDNKFFDKLASSLGLKDNEELIESAMIKIRNLKNEGFRKRVYGSKLGYRMLANDIYQTATVFPIATYLPIKPLDKTTILTDVCKDNVHYTLKDDKSKGFFKVVKDGERYDVLDMNGVSVLKDGLISKRELDEKYEIYNSPLTSKDALQKWNIEHKTNYSEEEYEKYIRQNNRIIDTYSKYYYKKFRLVDYDGSNSSYPEPEDRSIYTFGYTLPGHDYDVIEYPASTDSSSNIKNAIFSATILNKNLTEDKTSYIQGVNDDVSVIEPIIKTIEEKNEKGEVLNISFVSSEETLLDTEVHSVKTTIENYVKYQNVYKVPLNIPKDNSDLILNFDYFQAVYFAQYASEIDSETNKTVYKSVYADESGNIRLDNNISKNMLNTYYTSYLGAGYSNLIGIAKPVDVLYNVFVNNTLLLKPSETLEYYPTTVSTYKNPNVSSTKVLFNETPINWENTILSKGDYLVIEDVINKGINKISTIEEVTNFTKGFIKVKVDDTSFDGLNFKPISENDDRYAFVIENTYGNLVVFEGSISSKYYFSAGKYYITEENLNIAAIPEEKSEKLLSLLYESYDDYANELKESSDLDPNFGNTIVTLQDKISACIKNYGLSEELAVKYFSDNDDEYEEAKEEIKESGNDYTSFLSFVKEKLEIIETINSWKKNKEYIYENIVATDNNGADFKTEKTLVNTNSKVVKVLNLSRPVFAKDDAEGEDTINYSISNTFTGGDIYNISFGNINVVCLYDYDEINENIIIASDENIEQKSFKIKLPEDVKETLTDTKISEDVIKNGFDFYYIGVKDYAKKHETKINSVTEETNVNYYTQCYSSMDETFRNFTACGYSPNTKTTVITPPARDTIEIESVIDVETEGMENKISFESDEARKAFKTLSVGDIITGPSIDSDDGDVIIIKIGDNEVTTNVNLQKSGTFILKYSIKFNIYPTDVSDNLSQYKKDLYNNGLYEVSNPFEHGLWPSSDYPNVSNAILDSLPDISFYNVNNYWNNLHNSFTRVLEETHWDEFENLFNLDEVSKKYLSDKYLMPSDIKFNNELFLELNLNKLLYYPTHSSKTSPILMGVDWLDYIENSLMYSSRATDNVNVGVNVMMETDTTGYYTLISNNPYTDPNIHLKFITLNLDGQNMWPEKTTADDDWTIPCYAQVGTGGKGRERWFKSVDYVTYPSVYGHTPFDNTKKASEIDEDSDFYKQGGEIRNISVYGKNDTTNAPDAAAKRYTSVESPLFEIPLGEYDTIIKYAAESAANEAPNLLSITQASFYSQTFTDLLKYFDDSDKTFRIIGSDINTNNILTSINASNANEVFEFADVWTPTKKQVLVDDNGNAFNYDVNEIVYPINPLNMTYYVITEDVHLTNIAYRNEAGLFGDNVVTTSASFARSDVLFRKDGKWYKKSFQYMGLLGDGLDTFTENLLINSEDSASRNSITPFDNHAVSEISFTYVGELQPYNDTDDVVKTIIQQIDNNPSNFTYNSKKSDDSNSELEESSKSSSNNSSDINALVYTSDRCIVKFKDSYYIIHLYKKDTSKSSKLSDTIGITASDGIPPKTISSLFKEKIENIKINSKFDAIYEVSENYVNYWDEDIYNYPLVIEYNNENYLLYKQALWENDKVVGYDNSKVGININIISENSDNSIPTIGFTLEERLIQYYLRAAGHFTSNIEVNTILPGIRFEKNGLFFTSSSGNINCIENAIDELKKKNKDILDDTILYFLYVGTCKEAKGNAVLYYINRNWLSYLINKENALSEGDRLALTNIEDNWCFFRVNTTTLLGASLPISKWQKVTEAEMNIISGITETKGHWDIQSNLDKFNTVIDLPRSYLTEGSYNFDIILDPHFVADGYLYKDDETLSTETCKFCLTKGAIYYDDTNDCFYCYANLVTYSKTNEKILSKDVHKVAIKFNEQKYFKNVLNIAGVYQIKNATISGETDIVETPTFTSIDGVTFPLEKLASGDRLLQVKSMDLRSVYSNSLEPYFFSSYFTMNYVIKGVAPYTGNPSTGNYLYLSYLQERGDVISELNFITNISGLIPVSYVLDKATGTYNVISDVEGQTGLVFGRDVDKLDLYDIKITKAALSEDSISNSESETLVDRNPAYFKNNLVVRGAVNSANPNIIIAPSVDSELFRDSLSNISVGDTLVSAYALSDTGSEENFRISIECNGEIVKDKLQFVYFANNEFRAVTKEGVVYYNNDVEVATVTTIVKCKKAEIFGTKINDNYKGEILNVGYTSDIGWYVEISLLLKKAGSYGNAEYDVTIKTSIICQMYIDSTGIVVLRQMYENNAKKVFVDYDKDTIADAFIGGNEDEEGKDANPDVKNISTTQDTTTSTTENGKVTMHTLVSHTIDEFNNDFDVPSSLKIKFPVSMNRNDETIIIYNSTTTSQLYQTYQTTETPEGITDTLSYSVYNGVTGDWNYIENYYKANNDSVDKWVTTIMDNVGKVEYTSDVLTYSVPIRAFYVDDDFDLNAFDVEEPTFTWTYTVTKRDTDVDNTVLAQVFYLNPKTDALNKSLYFFTDEIVAKEVENGVIKENGLKNTYKVVVKVSNDETDGVCSAKVDYIFNVAPKDEYIANAIKNNPSAEGLSTILNQAVAKFIDGKLYINDLYVNLDDNKDFDKVETKTEQAIDGNGQTVYVTTVVATKIYPSEQIDVTVDEKDEENTSWNTYMYNENHDTYYTRQYNDPILAKLNESGVVTKNIGTFYNIEGENVVPEEITLYYRDITLNYAKLIQDKDDKNLYELQDGYSSEPYFAETLMTSNPNLSKNFLSDTILSRAVLAQDNSGKYSLYAKGRSLFIKSPTSMVEYDDVTKEYNYCGKLTPLSYWKHAYAPILKDKMFMNIRSLVESKPSDVDELIKRSLEQVYSLLAEFVNKNEGADKDSQSFNSYGLTINNKDITTSYLDNIKNILKVYTKLYGVEDKREKGKDEPNYEFSYLPTFEDFKEAIDKSINASSGDWVTVTNRFSRSTDGSRITFSEAFLLTDTGGLCKETGYGDVPNYYPYDTLLVKYNNNDRLITIRCYGFTLVNETITDDAEVTGACKKTFARLPYDEAGIPYFYQDIVINNDAPEINYNYAYSVVAYYLSYYMFGNNESTELINSTNINRVQFTNSSLLVFDIYGNVNSIGLSYLHNKDDIENPEHWSHSVMPNDLIFNGRNPDINGTAIFKIPFNKDKLSSSQIPGTTTFTPIINKDVEQTYKFLRVPTDIAYTTMSVFEATCSYANENVILLGGYTITLDDFKNLYLEMNSDKYPRNSSRGWDESVLAELDNDTEYTSICSRLKNWKVPMVLYSTNNGMSFDIVSLESTSGWEPWNEGKTDYVVTSIICAENEFKIFVNTPSNITSDDGIAIRPDRYYYIEQNDLTGLFDFSKTTDAKSSDEYCDLSISHEYDIDSDTGLDDGMDSAGLSSGDTAYLGKNNPVSALPTGSYKLVFTENDSGFNILSRKGLTAPLKVIGRTSNTITVSGNLVRRGNTTFDTLFSFDVAENIEDQMDYLNSDYFGDYLNKLGRLRVPEVTQVDGAGNANRFYSYRELLSDEQKDSNSTFYDPYGYPSVEEDKQSTSINENGDVNHLYEYPELSDEVSIESCEPVTMVNDKGSVVRLCDYTGKCLVYINNNAKLSNEKIVLGTFAQRATYPLELYKEASKPLYDTIAEAQNATNARNPDDALLKLLNFEDSTAISMSWDNSKPYISISLANETSVPKDVREYLFREKEDLGAFVEYLKNTSGELDGSYSTDNDMLKAIQDIKYLNSKGEDKQRYTPKYVYSSPESSLLASDNEQGSVNSGAGSIVSHLYWYDNYLGVFLFKSKRYFEALAYVPYTFKKGTTAYKNYGFSAVEGDSRYYIENPITGIYLSNYGYGGSRNNVINSDDELWSDKLPWVVDPDAFEDGYIRNTHGKNEAGGGDLVYLVNATGKVIQSYEAETERVLGDKYEVKSMNFNGQSSKDLVVYSGEDSNNKYTKTAYNLSEGDVSIFTPISSFDLGEQPMKVQLWVYKTNGLIDIDKVDGKDYRIDFKYYGRISRSSYGFVDAGPEFSYVVDSQSDINKYNKLEGDNNAYYKDGGCYAYIQYNPNYTSGNVSINLTSTNTNELKNNKFNTSFYVDSEGNIEVTKLYVTFYVDGKKQTVIYDINNWNGKVEGNKGFYGGTKEEPFTYLDSNGKKVRIFRIAGVSSASISFDKTIIYSNANENEQYTLMAQSISNTGFVGNQTENNLLFVAPDGINSKDYNISFGTKIMNCVASRGEVNLGETTGNKNMYALGYNSTVLKSEDYYKVTETYNNGEWETTRIINLPIFCIGQVLSTKDIIYPISNTNGQNVDINKFDVKYQTFTDNARIGSFKLNNEYISIFNEKESLKDIFENLPIEETIVNGHPVTVTDKAGFEYHKKGIYYYSEDSDGNGTPKIKIAATNTDGGISEDLFCYTFDVNTRTFKLIVNPEEKSPNDCIISEGLTIPGIPTKKNGELINYFINFYGDNGSVCYGTNDVMSIQVLGFNTSEYAEDELYERVYTNGTFGRVPCRKPKYNNFHDLVNTMGYVIDSGDDSILLAYDKNSQVLTDITTVDTDEGTVAFGKKLDLSGYNDGNEHYLLMKWLTQSTIKTELSMARDHNSYTEVSLADKTIFTPDRVWFNPEGYSTPPVTIGNNIYNVENNSEFTKTTYKNNNNYSIYRCNEEGHIIGYREVEGQDVLDYDTTGDGIPNGVEGYLTDEKGNMLSAAVEFEINPNRHTLKDAQIPIKPNFDSCQDWFKNEFYIEGKESNPYWQVLNITSYFNASKMIWEQNSTVNNYVKSSREMVLKEVKEDDRFINVSRTVSFENKNGNYIISTDSDLVNLKEGSIRFLLSKPAEKYQHTKQFIKYGITAENPFYKCQVWDGVEMETAGYLKSTYTVCSTKNLADPRDKESEVQEVTEMGLFNKYHQMIAYAIFPPIEYRTSTQHISFTCYIKQGSCLPLDQ